MLVAAIVLPALGILLSVVHGGRFIERIALLILLLNLAVSLCVFAGVWQGGAPLAYAVGGWTPPLGVALRADGLSATMMVTTATVLCAIALYACTDFLTPTGVREARLPFVYWPLLLGVCGAMNLVCIGGDLFTLYVAMELLTFAAVPMVSLEGRAGTVRAALRYLLFAVAGSLFYLLGIALLYGLHGTLDIKMLSQLIRPDFATIVALALATTGLLAKTALFPLHLWLPPAHAGAPAAASAVLSGLVVKGSFFLTIRLWFDAVPGLPQREGAMLLGALGAAAIVFGGVMALRQQRLKLLVAYSTVAQIGYLFLVFPLALNVDTGRLDGAAALAGGMLQVVSHAAAKAGMFMAAGTIYVAFGHDHIARLGGVGRALPLSVLAFVCGGCTLIGLPPGGPFLAKSLLLTSPIAAEQWWWDWVMFAGGTLTSSYMIVVLMQAFAPAAAPPAMHTRPPRYQELVALVLASTSLLLGLTAFGALAIVQIGRPDAADIPDPMASLTDVFTMSAIAKAFAPLLLGAAIAGLLQLERAPAAATDGLPREAKDPGAIFVLLDRVDDTLRGWPVGSSSLLLLTIAFGAVLFAAY